MVLMTSLWHVTVFRYVSRYVLYRDLCIEILIVSWGTRIITPLLGGDLAWGLSIMRGGPLAPSVCRLSPCWDYSSEIWIGQWTRVASSEYLCIRSVIKMFRYYLKINILRTAASMITLPDKLIIFILPMLVQIDVIWPCSFREEKLNSISYCWTSIPEQGVHNFYW